MSASAEVPTADRPDPIRTVASHITDEGWWSTFEGWAKLEAENHRPEVRGGGCTCGFCVWSAEHVLVMCIRYVQDNQHLMLESLSRGR